MGPFQTPPQSPCPSLPTSHSSTFYRLDDSVPSFPSLPFPDRHHQQDNYKVEEEIVCNRW